MGAPFKGAALEDVKGVRVVFIMPFYRRDHINLQGLEKGKVIYLSKLLSSPLYFLINSQNSALGMGLE